MNFTIDPLSPVTLLFTIVWIGLAAGLMLLATRQSSEWAKAVLAGFGLSILAWHTLAVVPSWWLYYAEGRMQWGGQGCVELKIAELFQSGSASNACLKQTVKDVVVVVENGVALGGFVVAFLIYQKRNPRQLAPGEAKPEATGGYK